MQSRPVLPAQRRYALNLRLSFARHARALAGAGLCGVGKWPWPDGNFAEVDRFLAFATGLRDQTSLTLVEVSFDVEGCRVMRDGA